MALTLKQWSRYSPYDLKVLHKNSKQYTIIGINYPYKDEITLHIKESPLWIPSYDCKPILKPIQELIKEPGEIRSIINLALGRPPGDNESWLVKKNTSRTLSLTNGVDEVKLEFYVFVYLTVNGVDKPKEARVMEEYMIQKMYVLDIPRKEYAQVM